MEGRFSLVSERDSSFDVDSALIAADATVRLGSFKVLSKRICVVACARWMHAKETNKVQFRGRLSSTTTPRSFVRLISNTRGNDLTLSAMNLAAHPCRG